MTLLGVALVLHMALVDALPFMSARPGALDAPCPGMTKKRLEDEAHVAELYTAERAKRTVRVGTGIPNITRVVALYSEVSGVIAKMDEKLLRDFAGPMVRLAFHDALSANPSRGVTFGGVDACTGDQVNPYHQSMIEGTRAALEVGCHREYLYNPVPSDDSFGADASTAINPQNCADLKYSNLHSISWAAIAMEEYCRYYEELSWSDCWMFISSIFLEATGGPPLDLSTFLWGTRRSAD